MFLSKTVYFRSQLQKDAIDDKVMNIGNGKIEQKGNEYNFTIRRNSDRQDRFIPVIKGKVFENNNIYFVNLNISLPLYIRIFMFIWLGILIIGFLVSFIMKRLDVDINGIKYGFVGLILVSVFCQYSFLNEFNKEKYFFMDLLKAEEIIGRQGEIK
jgi:hypothetical protein